MGTKNGEALGHNWPEADCENPKTCIVCNVTEGEALGHSVNVGLCSVCGSTVNEDLIYSLIDHMTALSEYMGEAGDIVDITSDFTNLDKTYENCKEIEQYLGKAEEEFSAVEQLTRDMEELSDMNMALNDALNAMPKELSGTDRDSLIAFLEEYKVLLLEYREVCLAFVDFLNSL